MSFQNREISLQRTVSRYEFVNDVEPEAYEPSMSQINGNMRLRTGARNHAFVNDVESNWVVESATTSSNGNTIIRNRKTRKRRTVTGGEFVNDVEKCLAESNIVGKKGVAAVVKNGIRHILFQRQRTPILEAQKNRKLGFALYHDYGST